MPKSKNIDLVSSRYKTAIARPQLSRPLQFAARHGFLAGQYSVFDYGCGRGHDVAILDVGGIDVSGWDPHYKKDSEIKSADLVNLGYVLNVIDSRGEREETLAEAYALAEVLLVVSVLIEGYSDAHMGERYGDGVITETGSFQKYFGIEEAKAFLEEVVGQEAFPVAKGIFFIFKDKIEEQRFLSQKHKRKTDIEHLLTLAPPSEDSHSWSDWVAFQEHKTILSDLWRRMVVLGRLPAKSELTADIISYIETHFGSIRKAAKVAQCGFDSTEILAAREARINDLKVYFALNLFNRRQSYSTLPDELQRDVNVFFSSYTEAIDVGRKLLFSVADTELIGEECVSASRNGIGVLDGDHSFQFHRDLLADLPTVLRVYVGCAEKLYGTSDECDLIKIHIGSGKVTFLEYENYDSSALPRLINRFKVNLREQSMEHYVYGEIYPQLLYMKSSYMKSSQKGYSKQMKFDKKLIGLNLFDFSNFGPSCEDFHKELESLGLCVQGWNIHKK